MAKTRPTATRQMAIPTIRSRSTPLRPRRRAVECVEDDDGWVSDAVAAPAERQAARDRERAERGTDRCDEIHGGG
jgi:hypothetical protein